MDVTRTTLARLASILVFSSVYLGWSQGLGLGPAVPRAHADTAGPNYAGAAGTNAWANPANAVGSVETTCAGNYGTTNVVGFWNSFGFSVPTGATINGIQVEIKVSYSTDPPAGPTINIGKNETTLGTAKSIPALSNKACGSGQTILSFGGATDLWGFASLTPADVNSANFTVRLNRGTAESQINLNWIRVTVHYTAACSAVADVTYLAATAQNGQATLYWSSPDPVLILRKTTAFAGEAPTNGTTYTVGATIGAATVVDNDTAVKTTFAQAGLTNGTTYHYKVFPKQSGTCYAPGVALNASPVGGTHPAWSYMLAGGSMLKPGIAGNGTTYTSSNASRIISLSTANGTQSWAPVATTSAVQGWLTWLPIASGDLTTGLVGHWKLDEGSGGTTGDASGNGLTGTLTSGPLWTAGKINQALSFDGVDDYVNVANAPALGITGNITVAAWIKRAAVSDYGAILAKTNGSTRWDYDFGFDTVQDNKLYFYSDGGTPVTIHSTGTLTDTAAWHHVAVTRSGSTVTFYIDGSAAGTVTMTGAFTNRADPVRIGTDGPGWSPTAFFNGLIDDVRLYNRALTAGEISSLYDGVTTIGGDQGGKVYAVAVAAGAQSWEISLSAKADAIQAPTAAQLRAYSDAAFQATYATDVLFAASRNSTATNCGTATTNNKVFAIRPTDGAVLWEFNGTCAAGAVDYIVGMPYVDYARNRLYVASRAGSAGTQSSLWVINTLNGGLVASFALGHLETSPAVSRDNNTLYVGNQAGDLYAINLVNLTTKWTSPSALGTAIKGFVWEDDLTAGRLYFSTADGNVWCLGDLGAGAPPNPATPVWKTAVAGPSAPLLLNALYVGSSDGKVHELNITTGLDQKQFIVGDGTSTVGDVSTEDGAQVFVGTAAGKLYKLPLPLP